MADPSAAMPPLAVLTRPSGRNEALAARLRAHGWEACVLPALEILPLDCLEGLPMPEDYDMVVFVSGNAARLYLDQLTRARGGFSWPPAVIAATVGPASAQGLRELPGFGANTTVLHPPADAPSHDSEALWAVLQDCPRCPRAPCWCAARRAATGWATPWPRTVCGWRDTPPTTGSPRSGRRNRWRRSSAGPKPGFPPPGSSPAGSADAALANLRAAGLQAWWEGCGFVLTHPSLARRVGRPGHDESGAAMVKICLPNDDSIFQAFVAA